jgi:hypothetical protein
MHAGRPSLFHRTEPRTGQLGGAQRVECTEMRLLRCRIHLRNAKPTLLIVAR